MDYNPVSSSIAVAIKGNITYVVNRIKHTELIIAFFFARDQFSGFSGSSGPFQSTTTNDCWREAVEPPVSVELEDPGGVRLLGSLLLRGLENILGGAFVYSVCVLYVCVALGDFFFFTC